MLRAARIAGVYLEPSVDRNQRRRRRLQGLIEEAGSVKLLAELAGTDPNYISQLTSPKGRGSFGDDLAERLEKAMKKPDGWMDQWLPEEGGYAAANRPPDWFLLELLSGLPAGIHKTIRANIIEAHRAITEATAAKRSPAKKRKSS